MICCDRLVRDEVRELHIVRQVIKKKVIAFRGVEEDEVTGGLVYREVDPVCATVPNYYIELL